MDAASSTMTFTHLFIIWTLLGVLLVWILLFASLALRRDKSEETEEPTVTLTSQTPVSHIAHVVVPHQTPPHVYEPVNEAAPIA